MVRDGLDGGFVVRDGLDGGFVVRDGLDDDFAAGEPLDLDRADCVLLEVAMSQSPVPPREEDPRS